MDMHVTYYSDIGKRKTNEDSVRADRTGEILLAVVADGLGGHGNGEYASREAVETICRALSGKEPSEEDLEDAVLEADEAVRQLHRTVSGALTTIAVLWLKRGRAFAANVGDTRIYQFRGGKVHFQSIDHSASQLAVMAGEITKEQIRGHKDRNKLNRVLGAENVTRMALYELEPAEGDRFLLCTDGFWETITEEHMLETAEGRGVEDWLREMRKSVDPSAKDNNTAIAILID